MVGEGSPLFLSFEVLMVHEYNWDMQFKAGSPGGFVVEELVRVYEEVGSLSGQVLFTFAKGFQGHVVEQKLLDLCF